MSLVLHNTLTRARAPFTPLDPAHVRIYVCGPTVYDRIHVGNARPLVVFDVLVRLLRALHPRVTYVRNITDVDDKIIERAAATGEPIDALTARTEAAFLADAEALGCLAPDVQPRATEHIAQMLELIAALIARAHAYQADGHVLFHVPSNPGYGRLSGRSRDEQVAGARVEVASYKKDAADFVLWKPSTADQPGWDSPYGRGRPGWHIECSAMAEHYLGLPFDIHGGGLDLVFPHHENEIAQSCCGRGVAEMARVWLHNGFVSVDGEKMAKSLGNFVTVADALTLAPGEAVRLMLLQTHYRAPLDFKRDGLAAAKATLDRFYTTLDSLSDVAAAACPPDGLLAALCDDLNTPKALAELHGLVTAANKASDPGERARLKGAIQTSGALLGLLSQSPQRWLQGAATGENGLDAATIDALIEERVAARRAKDFARADAIRDQLKSDGVDLLDGPQGTTWRRL